MGNEGRQKLKPQTSPYYRYFQNFTALNVNQGDVQITASNRTRYHLVSIGNHDQSSYFI